MSSSHADNGMEKSKKEKAPWWTRDIRCFTLKSGQRSPIETWWSSPAAALPASVRLLARWCRKPALGRSTQVDSCLVEFRHWSWEEKSLGDKKNTRPPPRQGLRDPQKNRSLTRVNKKWNSLNEWGNERRMHYVQGSDPSTVVPKNFQLLCLPFADGYGWKFGKNITWIGAED